MTQDEKIKLLADVLDCDMEDITPDTVLGDIEEWDSVAILSFIAMMDEEFGKTVKGAEIRQFVTVADALSIMEK